MRSRWIGVVAVVALVVVACGRSDGSKATNTETSSTTGSGKSSSFGSLNDVCQSGKPSGSPTTGVSPSEIHIATFSDVGFVGRPGLNQEFFDTADTFAAWCNDRGGINGRNIVVDKRDSALTNTKARMTETCATDFVMVGGGAVFDQDGVETRLQCLLPDFAGFVVSTQARGADLVIQPLPNSLKTLQIGILNYLGAKYPAATKNIGVLTGDISTTKSVADQNAEAAKSLGWNIVYNDAYPAAGTSDWTPYAEKLKSQGVKGLIWIGEPENLAFLLHALDDIGYTLDFVRADANHYDQRLLDLGKDSLAKNKVYVQSSVFPFEKATPSNPTGQYLQAFKDYTPAGKNRTYLGVQAWSAWLLFATAAKSCGNNLTRTCVYNAAKKITQWTGGGLHAETNPATGASSTCGLILQATPTGFVPAPGLELTDGPYRCSPKSAYQLTGDYGKGVTLADVGQNIKNMK